MQHSNVTLLRTFSHQEGELLCLANIRPRKNARPVISRRAMRRRAFPIAKPNIAPGRRSISRTDKRRLTRQSLEDFDSSVERAEFAVSELREPALQRSIGDGRIDQLLFPDLGQAQRQPPAIVWVRLTLDQP